MGGQAASMVGVPRLERSTMDRHETINYVEFPATNLEATKAFFEAVFGWSFVDYGPDYTAFSGQGLDGGFFRSHLVASVETGSALIVFYSDRLEDTQSKIENAGGRILKPIFAFPGGRRFSVRRAQRQRVRGVDRDRSLVARSETPSAFDERCVLAACVASSARADHLAEAALRPEPGGDYHYGHGPCWYAVRTGRTLRWQGDRTQSTILVIPNRNPFGGQATGADTDTGHATQKPVALFEIPRQSCSPGIVKLRLPAVFDAQYLGGRSTSYSST